jgi:hypothetical protein
LSFCRGFCRFSAVHRPSYSPNRAAAFFNLHPAIPLPASDGRLIAFDYTLNYDQSPLDSFSEND